MSCIGWALEMVQCPPDAGHAVSTISFQRSPMLSRRLAMMPQRFWNNEEGIAVTEYGLLIALVAVLLIGVVSVFSSSISSWFSSKTNKITSF